MGTLAPNSDSKATYIYCMVLPSQGCQVGYSGDLVVKHFLGGLGWLLQSTSLPVSACHDKVQLGEDSPAFLAPFNLPKVQRL